MLSEDLVRLGHQVSVIAALPHYPSGRVASEFRGRWLHREVRGGVDVTRVWVPSLNRARLGQRMLAFLCYQLMAATVGWRHRYDVMLVTNPALETALPFFALGVLRRKPVLFSVHEIYPEVGIELGVFGAGLTARAVRWLEDFCLGQAQCIRVLSAGFRRVLLARGVLDQKMAVVGDWLDTDVVRPLPRVNSFSREHGLNDAFVAMYAGNLGLSQGLEQLLAAAALLANNATVRFVVVGDGAAKEHLQRRAASEGLSNLVFLPLQPVESLPEVLATADVSIVVLKRGMARHSVPSKCYSIMASGRPLVAVVDPESDTWRTVREADCGLCVEPENPRALANAILTLAHDPDARARFAANGRAYVVERHSRMSAARRIAGLLSGLVLSQTGIFDHVPGVHDAA